MSQIIDFEKAKMRYRRDTSNDLLNVYANGVFEVINIDKHRSYIEFRHKRNGNTYKVVFNMSDIEKYKVGQRIKMAIKRKLFYTLWEVEYFYNIYLD